MPRRNQRDDSVPPLDLTPTDLKPLSRSRSGEFPGPRPYWAKPVEDPYLRRMREEREQADRQAEARKSNGIDWSVCLVPGCGRDLRVLSYAYLRARNRDTDHLVPLCDYHATVAWRQLQNRNKEPLVMRTTAEVDQEIRDKWAAQEIAAAEARTAEAKAMRRGLMYLVRINDLIKIGWTKDLPRRLKEYGAGAELLCHYPATLADETDLHRSLRPALAKGREWYHHDHKLVQIHLASSLKHHGPPRISAEWTQPVEKKDPIRLRRRR